MSIPFLKKDKKSGKITASLTVIYINLPDHAKAPKKILDNSPPPCYYTVVTIENLNRGVAYRGD